MRSPLILTTIAALVLMACTAPTTDDSLSSDSAISGVIPAGERVTSATPRESGGYREVTWKAQTGWVFAAYLEQKSSAEEEEEEGAETNTPDATRIAEAAERARDMSSAPWGTSVHVQ